MTNISVKDFTNDRIPRQILFWDGEDYCAGILFGTHIICGCCGGIFSLKEVIENAKESDKIAVKAFPTWVDLSSEIRGDTKNEDENLIELNFEEDM